MTHTEQIRRILMGIGWPVEIPKFDPPYELFAHEICQLVPYTEDGFHNFEAQMQRNTGPDPPSIAEIDSPQWEDIADGPHWKE